MLSSDDVITFIQRRYKHGVEIDGPDSVVGFLEAYVLIDERVGDVKELVLKAWITGLYLVATRAPI